jgi:hypothetical protein
MKKEVREILKMEAPKVRMMSAEVIREALLCLRLIDGSRLTRRSSCFTTRGEVEI